MRRVALLALGAGLLLHCKPAPVATPAPPNLEDEARSLVQQGRPDEALARLESLPAGPGVWSLQGQAWAKKAETAPLPTPPPPAPGARPGELPPTPEFKPEELKAVELLERAITGKPGLGSAHGALASLLAPHALRRHLAQAQAASKKRRGPGAPAATEASAPGEPDWSTERVLREYQAAGQAPEATLPEIRVWIGFAEKVGRLAEAEAGYVELVKRDHENPEPLVSYGDFVARMRKDPQRAFELYQRALIWRPDDATVKARMADICLDLGYENYKRREYMAAQVRYDEARKYAKDPQSPQFQRLRSYEALLREIRQGTSR